ncbi:hypothetical protein ACLB2K_041650 [Fragaria x ananassa]
MELRRDLGGGRVVVVEGFGGEGAAVNAGGSGEEAGLEGVNDSRVKTLSSGQDGSAVIVKSVIEGCNDGYLRNERTHTLLEEECSPTSIKRKRLSEAILDKQNQCQELDEICSKNSWVLPVYCVSLSDGGFQANVTVEGLDFKCSKEGDLCSGPSEARESAAFQMLEKLRNMAGQAKKVAGQ